eukprot:3188604-Lingulodinium_polyedra.AAC.1
MPLSLLNVPEDDSMLTLYSEESLPDTVELAFYPPKTNTVEYKGQLKNNEIVLLHTGKSVRQT